MPTYRRRCSASAPRAGSRSPASRCCACGSPTSASWATSSTSRPPTPCACTTRCWPAARRTGCGRSGSRALASLRMEKAYRDFGHDIDNTDCPLEAGLGFALALDKPGGFVGRDAVLARKVSQHLRGGTGQRIVQLRVLDPISCCSTRRSCTATVRRSATSARRRTAGPSAGRSAWPWSPAAASRSPRTG